jgi:hypothetical protein
MVVIILMVLKWTGIYLFVGLVLQGIAARMLPEKCSVKTSWELFLAMIIWPLTILYTILKLGWIIVCWFANGFRVKGSLR